MSMSHRQMLSLRELRMEQLREAAEIEDRKRAAEEERTRPLKEAEAALKATAVELGKLTREKILTQRDDEFLDSLDTETKGLKLPRAEADKFNVAQLEIFKSQRPDAYWSKHNHDAVGDYLARNGFVIVPAHVLEAAWERLSLYGLLESAPAPEPEPTPEPTRRPIQREVQAPEPETFEGWDPNTGERRKYSKWDVERMTGDEYRRAFRVYKEALRLPTRPAF